MHITNSVHLYWLKFLSYWINFLLKLLIRTIYFYIGYPGGAPICGGIQCLVLSTYIYLLPGTSAGGNSIPVGTDSRIHSPWSRTCPRGALCSLGVAVEEDQSQPEINKKYDIWKLCVLSIINQRISGGGW